MIVIVGIALWTMVVVVSTRAFDVWSGKAIWKDIRAENDVEPAVLSDKLQKLFFDGKLTIGEVTYLRCRAELTKRDLRGAPP